MSEYNQFTETALTIRNQFEIEKELDFQKLDKVQQFEQLKKLLASKLTQMIDHEFDKFINTLYRIDVNESKVKEILADEPMDKAIELIADLIIHRQMEKAITRKKYAPPGEDLNFDV